MKIRERRPRCSSYIIAQFLGPLQCSLDPDNFYLAGRDLTGRFAMTSCGYQTALVASQHAPKHRHGTFLRLRMRTAKADQSLRAMLSGGQSAEVRAHVAQLAARCE